MSLNEFASNTSDGQLFLYNIADKSIKPLTKDFAPSVDSYEWNALDKQIYITAKDKDRVRMYSLNPSNGKIKQLQAKEDVISDYSIANQAFEMVYFGLSASNSQRLYTYNLKNDASSCLIDLSKEILRDVTLGEVQDWNFVSAHASTIYGRRGLPNNFNAVNIWMLSPIGTFVSAVPCKNKIGVLILSALNSGLCKVYISRAFHG